MGTSILTGGKEPAGFLSLEARRTGVSGVRRTLIPLSLTTQEGVSVVRPGIIGHWSLGLGKSLMLWSPWRDLNPRPPG